MITRKRKEYLKTWFKTHPNYRRNWMKAHPGYGKKRFENPIHRRKVVCAHLRRAYGISLTDFRDMIKEQDHKCLICNRRTKLVVDHDHKTGRVRGLLCRGCNAVLYVFDDKKLFKRILKYLERK